MKNICAQFKDQQESPDFYRGQDQTSVPNFAFLKNHAGAFSKEGLHKSYQETSLRAEQLFLDTQANVLRFLYRKRRHFSNDEYSSFVQKIKTVHLSSLLDPKIQRLAAGACRRPNAIYIKGFHELLICPSLLNMPTLTLEKVLAHEFGHAIQAAQSKITCFERFPARQAEEAFADWVASEVIAENIRQEVDKVVAKKKAIESQMLFLSLACFTAETTHSYSYPSIQNRVEKIFLAQVAFQEVLHCQNPNVPHCE
jgi:hypothetical protein